MRLKGLKGAHLSPFRSLSPLISFEPFSRFWICKPIFRAVASSVLEVQSYRLPYFKALHLLVSPVRLSDCVNGVLRHSFHRKPQNVRIINQCFRHKCSQIHVNLRKPSESTNICINPLNWMTENFRDTFGQNTRKLNRLKCQRVNPSISFQVLYS